MRRSRLVAWQLVRRARLGSSYPRLVLDMWAISIRPYRSTSCAVLCMTFVSDVFYSRFRRYCRGPTSMLQQSKFAPHTIPGNVLYLSTTAPGPLKNPLNTDFAGRSATNDVSKPLRVRPDRLVDAELKLLDESPKLDPTEQPGYLRGSRATAEHERVHSLNPPQMAFVVHNELEESCKSICQCSVWRCQSLCS
jgi:hypothetical protein